MEEVCVNIELTKHYTFNRSEKKKTTSREYHTYILTRVGLFSFSIYTFTHIYISHPIYLLYI